MNQPTMPLALRWLSALLAFTSPAVAQNPAPPSEPEAAALRVVNRLAPQPVRTPGSALPIWRYQIVSPLNGVSYSGYMVGTDPFTHGPRTVSISVILVPFIVQFTNTTTGFTTTFDPSAAPDGACTAGLTAMNLVENSPIFQNYHWILNGLDLGTTQYIDAYQRSNFSAGYDHHTLLRYSVGNPLVLPLSYSSPTLAAEVRTGVTSTCTNSGGSGSTNGGGYQGIVDFNALQTAMADYIASNQITPDQFPIFILYNVMYSQNGLLYLGGYHFSEAKYPAVLTSPGQTYTMANFRTNGSGPYDVSILSHEIAEWIDDPGGYNAVPPWGKIGSVTDCRRNLEVGDPLTQTDLPPVVGQNGFAYHLQELAYSSWFFRTPSLGAGGKFSNNGTLAIDAGPLCQ